MDIESDPELIARTLAGEPNAFDTLVRRHYRTAYSVALAHTGNRPDAEDVCHDAFVRAAEKLETCRTREHFSHWLCVIVRNQARNATARRHVRRTEPIDQQLAAEGEDPSRHAEITDLRDRLLSALAVLTITQREVVLMHDLQGWSHEEIATAVGTSVGMSRQHLFTARRKLREALGLNTSRDHFHG